MPRKRRVALNQAVDYSLDYTPPGPVAARFMRSDTFVRGIRGPVGSGKSACCCIEIFRRALEQKKGPDGLRKSRWVVVRNTLPELKTTTIKTWLDWFPEHVFGSFNWSPPFTHHIRRGDLDLEVIFLALDRDEDVKKLLSLEVTGVWINEARELSKAIIDGCTMRVGRYPSMKDGGSQWYGVIMDTNAMEPDHWWPIMSGDAPIPEDMDPDEALMLAKPDNWEFFVQPPGMNEVRDETGKNVVGYEINPQAENIGNLTPEYYTNMIRGKTRSWINLYVRNQLGSAQDGKTVYPSFREEVHVTLGRITPIPNLPLLIGVDFGLTPAAAIGQRLRGRWFVLKEVVSFDMGAVRFAEHLKAILSERYSGFECSLWGDPTGDNRAQTDETTPFQIFRQAGLPILPAPTNDPVVRIEAVTLQLEKMVEGKPAFTLDPSCILLKAGFIRGYHYAKVQASGMVRYADRPNKNRYSHIHDALQYMMVGAGEGRAVLTGKIGGRHAPIVASTDFNVFG